MQASSPANDHAVATFGGGCFWCVEAVFERLRGVSDVVSGYANGHVPNPTYRQVCAGTTGHAEVVQIQYDPAEVSYRELVEIFLTTHDPTTPNRQGNDVGPQYRSIICTHDDAQAETARAVIDRFEAEGVYDAPIVTAVEPLDTFYRAEDDHQDYFRHNPQQPYCQFVVAPKVAKLRQLYHDRLAEA